MLVISRDPGDSFFVGPVPGPYCLIHVGRTDASHVALTIIDYTADHQEQSRKRYRLRTRTFRQHGEIEMLLVDTRPMGNIHRVRIGLSAPRSHAVHRLEIYEAVHGPLPTARKRRGRG